MHADGEQLRQLAALVEAGSIKPVVDRALPLDVTAQALAHVEAGRAKDKEVIHANPP